MTLETTFPAFAIPSISRPPALGRVFYVDATNGANTNNGVDPGTAFATIGYALDQCVNLRNDYIIVLDCWGEAGPIDINKTMVHLMGIGNTPNRPWAALAATGDNPCFLLSSLSNGCEIAGFMLGGGATQGGIDRVGGTPMGAHIHHCVFGSALVGDTPAYGIRLLAGTALRINDCIFVGTGADAGGTITIDGIQIRVSQHSAVMDCIFMGCPNIGLHLSDSSHIVVMGNRFTVPDLANGEAITVAGAAAAGCLVTDNHAMAGGDGVMGTNPYRDVAGAGVNNHWGQNFAGAAAAALPVCA